MPLTTTPCRQSDGVSGCLEILEKEQQLQVGIFVKNTVLHFVWQIVTTRSNLSTKMHKSV